MHFLTKFVQKMQKHFQIYFLKEAKMPNEQAVCEQAQPNEMSEARKKLLGDLHAEADELAQKIERLQAFVLKVGVEVEDFNAEYLYSCQKQLAFMQEYHKILCERMRKIRGVFGEEVVNFIGKIYQRKA